MADQTSTKNVKIVTRRPEGQKREYANYVEFSINPGELSLKFCDLKPPPTKEEIETIEKEGKVEVVVNSEIVLPFDVAEDVIGKLKGHIDNIKESMKKEGK